MNRKIMYGNPYTGYQSSDRKLVEKTLEQIGKGKPFKISHTVHNNDKIYKWVIGSGRLK